jgi:hypothetical protein
MSRAILCVNYPALPLNRKSEPLAPLVAGDREAILDLSDQYAVKYGMKPDQANLRRLLMAESGINPLAVNKTSGACGLGQALPCSKMKCELTDVECQLDWVMQYIKNRYGSIRAANEWQLEKGWY